MAQNLTAEDVLREANIVWDNAHNTTREEQGKAFCGGSRGMASCDRYNGHNGKHACVYVLTGKVVRW